MRHHLSTRRIMGVVFLLIAATEVALGMTVLKGRLGALAALLFWTSCLLATFAAILCAMLDAMRCLTDSRRERRQLLEQTLREIDEERGRRGRAKPGLPESH